MSIGRSAYAACSRPSASIRACWLMAVELVLPVGGGFVGLVLCVADLDGLARGFDVEEVLPSPGFGRQQYEALKDGDAFREILRALEQLVQRSSASWYSVISNVRVTGQNIRTRCP